jgi:hypothetical protein
MKRNESQKDTVLGIINCMENGRNIGQYLIDRGFLNPESTFDNAKLYAKRNMPDEYEKIKDLKASKVCRSEQTETRTKREHRKTESRHEASPSCCQPAKPSGVTVPDELPEESLKIAALLSSFDPDFRYELSNIKCGKGRVVSLVWREPMGGGERSLNMTTDEWQLFAKEIPLMLKQLGLI